jgi:hypothetical protein
MYGIPSIAKQLIPTHIIIHAVYVEQNNIRGAMLLRLTETEHREAEHARPAEHTLLMELHAQPAVHAYAEQRKAHMVVLRRRSSA